MEIEVSKCEIDCLPEACVSYILSFTSPRDSCRAAVVSTAFSQAADSDTVWSRFLPSDYREVLSRAVDSFSFSSCKELYFKLCNGVLIDAGRKAFSLDKGTGVKCFTLCAKELDIPWVYHQMYWRWISHPESRFTEVAELCEGYWLQVQGSINCSELSPNTTYESHLIFKIRQELAYGLRLPQKVSVKLGTQISEGNVCIHPNEGEGRVSGNRREIPPEVRVPKARSDGWMEVELGEFYNEDGCDEDVCMSFMHVKRSIFKRGLIIEGIQVRPKVLAQSNDESIPGQLQAKSKVKVSKMVRIFVRIFESMSGSKSLF